MPLKIIRNRNILYWGFIILIVTLVFGITTPFKAHKPEIPFSADRAYADVVSQLTFGSRIPGSEAHRQTVNWIEKNLNDADWDTSVEEFSLMDHAGKNIIARRGKGNPWIILGAHYDSRILADQDPDIEKRKEPVPGANDGASGVAVLLEIARILPEIKQGQVWLVFFDLEDQGNLPGWDWILGSRAFTINLNNKPDAVVIIDMIGDKDLNIFKEQNSNSQLSDEIWGAAKILNYQSQFINSTKYRILDDHIPFLKSGIPAVDLIDFDYLYWHKTTDSVDKVSAASLAQVGNTLIEWLKYRQVVE